MYWKGIVTELLWFLRGDTNIKYLVDNDCHIWDGDAYKAYCQESPYPYPTMTQPEFIDAIKTDDEFAKKWGELGPIYGKQWRNWTKDKDAGSVEGGVFVEYEQIDQIENLIKPFIDLNGNTHKTKLFYSRDQVSSEFYISSMH